MRPQQLLGYLAGLTVLVALACGGSNSSSKPKEAEASLDLSQATAMLNGLDSFRFDFVLNRDFGNEPSTAKLEGFGSGMAAALFTSVTSLKGDGVVASPKDIQLNLNFDGKQLAFVQVQGKSWANYGAAWTPVSGSASLGLGQSPADLLKMLPQAKLSGGQSARETRDGMHLTHYIFDKAALQGQATQLTRNLGDVQQLSDAHLEAWVNDDLVPVRLSLSIAGKGSGGGKVSMRFEMNVAEINSTGLSVKAPV